MKKRFLSLSLALLLLLSLFPAAALAADLSFTDVSKNVWYYSDVAYAVEMDLINGRDERTFDPNSSLTWAEAVKLAACMHQRCMTGGVSFKSSSPWYQTYVDYAKENGILRGTDYSWNSPISRAGYLDLFSRAIPDSSPLSAVRPLTAINEVADGAIPDVPMSHPQAQAIYKLYRAGIVQGVDEQFRCSPDSEIRRCEVAAILTRMMDAGARKSFSLGAADSGEYNGFIFTTSDRDGKTWDQSAFSGHRLTMINFWEPWCGPCVSEMPSLQKLQQDYADRGFQILGVYSTNDMEEDVDYVLEDTGVRYPILHWCREFAVFETGYVPTTVFLNEKGEVLGEPYVGSMSYSEWAKVVEGLL